MNIAGLVDIVLLVCLALLAVAMLLALVRLEKGPTMFDRVVSLEVVTVVVLGAGALMTARAGRTDLVPMLVVLAVVGFVGSVALARFAAVETPEESRILSKEELARAQAAQQALDDAAGAVHDPDAVGGSRDTGPDDTPGGSR